jgi:hypothetical protein
MVARERVEGRRLRCLPNGRRAVAHTLSWDGRNESVNRILSLTCLRLWILLFIESLAMDGQAFVEGSTPSDFGLYDQAARIISIS